MITKQESVDASATQFQLILKGRKATSDASQSALLAALAARSTCADNGRRRDGLDRLDNSAAVDAPGGGIRAPNVNSLYRFSARFVAFAVALAPYAIRSWQRDKRCCLHEGRATVVDRDGIRHDISETTPPVRSRSGRHYDLTFRFCTGSRPVQQPLFGEAAE